ncbi:MAG: hypothetical protein DRQ60_07970 [Gammaproteobacteria bacterium]|nr:MAG: hypothetical protein DRQ60_07970 [Gammaproteobacteria bacterium]
MVDKNKELDPYTEARSGIEKAATEAEIIEVFEKYDATEGKLKRRAAELNEELDSLEDRRRIAEKELDVLSRNKFFRQVSVESVAADKVFKLRLAEWRENEDVT